MRRCQGISGVLLIVRLTTCKRLTNSLPKRSLITLSPHETAGYQVGQIYGRTCQYPSGFISWGNRVQYFSSSTWGKSEKVCYCGWWDLNLRPPKNMVCRRRHFLRVLGGDTECPLQVCQLSRSSESTHLLSLSRDVDFY